MKNTLDTTARSEPFVADPEEAEEFVTAYVEIAAQSDKSLVALKRKFAAPIRRVLYHDLEQAIWIAWRVRPADMTVDHIRHALYLLARNREGGVGLDRLSCELSGIDYVRLVSLIRPSAGNAEEMAAGSKVPRNLEPGKATGPPEVVQFPVENAGAESGGETGATAPDRTKKRGRGRPTLIGVIAKEAALKARERGESWGDAAKLLYSSPYPSAQQVKNAPNVVNYYRRTRVPRDNS